MSELLKNKSPPPPFFRRDFSEFQNFRNGDSFSECVILLRSLGTTLIHSRMFPFYKRKCHRKHESVVRWEKIENPPEIDKREKEELFICAIKKYGLFTLGGDRCQ